MTIEKRDRDALIKYKIERAEETIEDAVIKFNKEDIALSLEQAKEFIKKVTNVNIVYFE